MVNDTHPSHTWGPHKRGIRWVQCQTCECLLHEPEAKLPCDAETVRAGREERAAKASRTFLEIAKREAGLY